MTGGMEIAREHGGSMLIRKETRWKTPSAKIAIPFANPTKAAMETTTGD
jgi:hypothetical protein